MYTYYSIEHAPFDKRKIKRQLKLSFFAKREIIYCHSAIQEHETKKLTLCADNNKNTQINPTTF